MKRPELFQNYSKLGFRIFPLRRRTKKPAIKDNLNQATTDLDKIREWSRTVGRPNWGLSLAKSGLVAVDIDVRKLGIEKWTKLIEEHGDPETLSATTPSRGKHYVFKAKPGIRYKGKISDGIDIKHNGFIVIEPSTRNSLQMYRWDSDPATTPINDYPDWLAKLIEKRLIDRPTASMNIPTPEAAELALLVDEIQRHELDYDEWVRVGMAIKSMLPTEEGRQLYLRATENLSYHSEDTESAYAKWDSFSNDRPDAVGVGTLIRILQSKGADLSKFRLAQDKRLFADTPEHSPTPEGAKIEGQNYVWSRAELLVKSIDDLGIFYLESEEGSSFGQRYQTPIGDKRFLTFGHQKLKSQVSPYKLKVTVNGKPKLLDSDKIWVESRNRKTYSRICFSPCASPRELNLWHVPEIQPIVGDCSLVFAMIKDSLCAGNERLAEFVIKYLAHIIQKPAEKVITVPVFISTKEGTGKGLLNDEVMRGILGDLFIKVRGVGTLGERFNGHLAFRWMTFIDEADWDPTKSGANALKALTGSRKMTIEHKFGAKFEIDNYSRYVIATNNPASVAIGTGNRRYLPIESSERYADNKDYFDPIRAAIRDDKMVNHIFAALKSIDLSDFDPNRPPVILDSGIEARLKTEGLVAQFWHYTFFHQPQPIFESGKGLIASLVWQEFEDFGKGQRIPNRSDFWMRSKYFMPSLNCKPKEVRGYGPKTRAYLVDLMSMVRSFCEKLRLVLPDDFDESRFLVGEGADDFANTNEDVSTDDF